MTETEWDKKLRAEAQARMENLPPRYDHYVTKEAVLHWPHHVELMRSDGWQPRSEYRPGGGEYVYVKGYTADLGNPCCAIARGGWHETSWWYNPDGQPMGMDVREWKKFPDDDGVTPYQRWQDWKTMRNNPRWVRPPEPVYEPGGTGIRLTPVPRKLLMEVHGGARLEEHAWRWTEWVLHQTDQGPEKISERGINALRKVAFIERDGVLPPGRLPRWFVFDWKITDAGKAWIEANKQGEKL
jgi:hypothetical protein